MRPLIIAALSSLLLSCWEHDENNYLGTPKGYKVEFHNIGSLPDWYSQEEVLTFLDNAIEDAAVYLWKYGVSQSTVEQYARSYKYVAYDMPRFAITASETGWASGAWSQQYRTIQLAFWARAKADIVPSWAPPWTVYSWPTRPSPAFDYGTTPHYPATAHEIGHAIFGAAFEHGWTPPIVNYASSGAGVYSVTSVPSGYCVIGP